MVSKGSQPGQNEPGHEAHANLQLVPSATRYAHNCGFLDEAEYARSALGVGGLFDQVSCVVPMAAGDILFFREDVWHRTQDTLVDRLAFIFDIGRYPLPDTPEFADDAMKMESLKTNLQLTQIVNGVLQKEAISVEQADAPRAGARVGSGRK